MNTPFPFLRAGMLALATLVTLATAAAGRDGWSTDFEAAKKQAAAEKKDLLLDFTGSDWCGFCIKLDKEVFQQDAFKTGFKDKLVLVEFDFPKIPKNIAALSDATKAQNAMLDREFKVEGRLPAVFLCDASGKPYAKTGYRRGGIESYVTHLNALMDVRAKRDAAFAAAARASDKLDKARNLAAGLKAMEIELVEAHYADVLAKLEELDKDDSTGFRKELNDVKAKRTAAAEAAKPLSDFMQAKVMPLMQAREFDKAYAEVVAFIQANATLPDPLKADLSLNIGLPRFVEKGDVEGAAKFVDEVIANFPKLELAKNRDQIMQQVRARLQQIKNQPAGAPAPAAPQPE